MKLGAEMLSEFGVRTATDLFHMFDTDCDGSLSQGELNRALRTLFGGQLTDQQQMSRGIQRFGMFRQLTEDKSVALNSQSAVAAFCRSIGKREVKLARVRGITQRAGASEKPVALDAWIRHIFSGIRPCDPGTTDPSSEYTKLAPRVLLSGHIGLPATVLDESSRAADRPDAKLAQIVTQAGVGT